ncbi:unnamed protein product [Polarella glacialis]|uniref:Uncharacterized protein n=1 Tax=Polarella glacialis TaxID=89957 RepID=A0A813GX08_POLGL|nr:unnamed protein product [Polarella glacialis]
MNASTSSQDGPSRQKPMSAPPRDELGHQSLRPLAPRPPLRRRGSKKGFETNTAEDSSSSNPNIDTSINRNADGTGRDSHSSTSLAAHAQLPESLAEHARIATGSHDAAEADIAGRLLTLTFERIAWVEGVALGDRVQVRDCDSEPWRRGTVVSIDPVRVKMKGGKEAFSFQFIQPEGYGYDATSTAPPCEQRRNAIRGRVITSQKSFQLARMQELARRRLLKEREQSSKRAEQQEMDRPQKPSAERLQKLQKALGHLSDWNSDSGARLRESLFAAEAAAETPHLESSEQIPFLDNGSNFNANSNLITTKSNTASNTACQDEVNESCNEDTSMTISGNNTGVNNHTANINDGGHLASATLISSDRLVHGMDMDSGEQPEELTGQLQHGLPVETQKCHEQPLSSDNPTDKILQPCDSLPLSEHDTKEQQEFSATEGQLQQSQKQESGEEASPGTLEQHALSQAENEQQQSKQPEMAQQNNGQKEASQQEESQTAQHLDQLDASSPRLGSTEEESGKQPENAEQSAKQESPTDQDAGAPQLESKQETNQEQIQQHKSEWQNIARKDEEDELADHRQTPVQESQQLEFELLTSLNQTPPKCQQPPKDRTTHHNPMTRVTAATATTTAANAAAPPRPITAERLLEAVGDQHQLPEALSQLRVPDLRELAVDLGIPRQTAVSDSRKDLEQQLLLLLRSHRAGGSHRPGSARSQALRKLSSTGKQHILEHCSRSMSLLRDRLTEDEVLESTPLSLDRLSSTLASLGLQFKSLACLPVEEQRHLAERLSLSCPGIEIDDLADRSLCELRSQLSVTRRPSGGERRAYLEKLSKNLHETKKARAEPSPNGFQGPIGVSERSSRSLDVTSSLEQRHASLVRDWPANSVDGFDRQHVEACSLTQRRQGTLRAVF